MYSPCAAQHPTTDADWQTGCLSQEGSTQDPTRQSCQGLIRHACAGEGTSSDSLRESIDSAFAAAANQDRHAMSAAGSAPMQAGQSIFPQVSHVHVAYALTEALWSNFWRVAFVICTLQLPFQVDIIWHCTHMVARFPSDSALIHPCCKPGIDSASLEAPGGQNLRLGMQVSHRSAKAWWCMACRQGD